MRHLSIPVSACKNQSADKSYASENKKGSETEDERTATLELLNQRGKESENVCHRRRIRIGGREEQEDRLPTPYLQLKCRSMDAVLEKAEKCWKKAWKKWKY